jgi:hypothetical protein
VDRGDEIILQIGQRSAAGAAAAACFKLGARGSASVIKRLTEALDDEGANVLGAFMTGMKLGDIGVQGGTGKRQSPTLGGVVRLRLRSFCDQTHAPI